MERWPDLTGPLSGVKWAIAGAVATRAYMPERATRDLDIVVLLSDEKRATQALHDAGYTKSGELAIPGSSWRAPSGQEVDLLTVDGSRWSDALERAVRRIWGAPL